MFAEEDGLGLNFICGLEHRLAGINRELRFIARTIARLRHRHHAALIFSSKQSHTSKQTSHSRAQSPKQTDLVSELQQRLRSQYIEMLKRLFLTPKKERQEDEESAPTTPVNEQPPPPPRLLIPGPQRPQPGERRHTAHPASLTPSTIASPARPRPLSMSYKPYSAPVVPAKRPLSWNGSIGPEIITFVVDERSQAIFELPRHHVSVLATQLPPQDIAMRTHRDSDSQTTLSGIYLPKVSVADFSDFATWTRTGRIMQYPHNGIEYHIEHQARRLIAALSLGCKIGSIAYQNAAITELHSVGSLLEWPEDFVNDLFAATNNVKIDDHPARTLMVAIVTAKTCGAGKRQVRAGPRDKNIERGDRIASTTFWRMFDAYCAQKGPECDYPGDVDEHVVK